MAWIIPFIPAIVGAAAGVGAAVYTANKAEDAADQQQKVANSNKRERMELDQQKQLENASRAKSENHAKNMMDDEAAEGQMGAMENAAANEKAAREAEKALMAKESENEYASKFKPGSGGLGEDTASDFLVPKVADDTGLVRDVSDKGADGLVAQIGFGG